MPRRKLYLASVLGQFIPVVWLGVLGATLATKNGTVDPGALIVDTFGALAIPVLLLVIHGPIATNILNIYTFSVAAQALDVKIKRRTLSVVVGGFAMAAVIFFVFQADLGSVLDTWLIGIVAWIAAWGGIMLVHYYKFAEETSTPTSCSSPSAASDSPTSTGPPWSRSPSASSARGCSSYGLTPALQGFAAAMGGLDLSWLAGGLVAAAPHGLGWSLLPSSLLVRLRRCEPERQSPLPYE